MADSREYQIELTWVCSSCSQRNRGREMACVQCGNPKQDAEAYEMPADPGAAPEVQSPELASMAKAGPNWRCKFCGSSARARWGACAECGAQEASPPPQAFRLTPARSPSRPYGIAVLVGVAAAVAITGAVIVGSVGAGARRDPTQHPGDARAASWVGPGQSPAAVHPPGPTFRDIEAVATGGRYLHEIKVDRFTLVPREGFAETKPSDAVDVKAQGERVHHHDRVQQGTRKESYTDYESKMVTETYTERERCGEDCQTTPRSCRRNCTNSKNGFANCKETCTGGDRKCTTKYCSNTKTRTVSKRVPVEKTRDVPNFVDVPRHATWFEWKVWDWRFDRALRKEGNGFVTVWPDAKEVRLGLSLATGEKEREARSTRYEVLFAADDGTSQTLLVPTLDGYRAFEGARAKIRVHDGGGVDLLAGPFAPTAPVASASVVASTAASAPSARASVGPAPGSAAASSPVAAPR